MNKSESKLGTKVKDNNEIDINEDKLNMNKGIIGGNDYLKYCINKVKMSKNTNKWLWQNYLIKRRGVSRGQG